jgi:hypothetical protein
LLWELIRSILDLVDDRSGYASGVFATACDDLGPLAVSVSIDPEGLAALVFQKITNNPYGIYDGSIRGLDRALGKDGRAKLRSLLLQRRQQYLTNDKGAAFAAGRHDLELLREVVSNLAGLVIMANPGAPGALLEMREVQEASRRLGLEVATLEIRRPDDIAPAIEALKGHADALYVATDPLVFTNRIRINTLAQELGLPTIYGSRGYVEAGALMSYGPNFPDLFRRAAEYVDKILRGTKPADIPVEQPTKFDLVINLKTSKAIGLQIPDSFLIRADEVIE